MAEEAVAGILLAGGGSSRFGSDKLEERVEGVRLVDLACRNFLDAGLEPVVLVGGPLPEEHVLHMRPAHPTQHMIDTLRLGLRMIDGPFAFAPADMPALAPDLIRELLKVFQGSGRDYLVPSHAGVRELADDGYVVRLAGVGTFVADARPHSDVLKVRNIADEIHARGHDHFAKVIKLEEVEANQRLVEKLELRPGDKLFHSVILHMESGKPIQLEDRYVCPRLAPDYLNMDFTKITPNVYLTKVAPMHTAEHIIRAVIPTQKVRRLLNMEEKEPCLVIRRRTWTAGRPVSLAELSHPGYTYELIGTMAE